MKVVKKWIVLLAAMIVAVCAVVGCSGKNKNDVTGTTWAVKSATDSDGNEYDSEYVESMFGAITYEFKEEGVVTVTAAGMSSDAQWSQDGKTVTVGANGSEIDFTVDGNQLTFEEDGISFILEKQE